MLSLRRKSARRFSEDNDYEHMQNMIFDEKPEFDSILVEIQKLEKEINV